MRGRQRSSERHRRNRFFVFTRSCCVSPSRDLFVFSLCFSKSNPTRSKRKTHSLAQTLLTSLTHTHTVIVPKRHKIIVYTAKDPRYLFEIYYTCERDPSVEDEASNYYFYSVRSILTFHDFAQESFSRALRVRAHCSGIDSSSRMYRI